MKYIETTVLEQSQKLTVVTSLERNPSNLGGEYKKVYETTFIAVFKKDLPIEEKAMVIATKIREIVERDYLIIPWPGRLYLEESSEGLTDTERRQVELLLIGICNEDHSKDEVVWLGEMLSKMGRTGPFYRTNIADYGYLVAGL